MTEFVCSNAFLLLVWSNKNSSIFGRACKTVAKDFEHEETIGIVYDDLDTKGETENRWKSKFPDIKIYSVAPRRYTVKMDDKINLSECMGQSKYIPKWYLKYSDIPKDTEKNQLFYVKKRGSTASKGVYLHKYSNMNEIDTKNCVIQEDLNNPYIYEKRRFKIRAYILIFQNSVYINRKAWCSLGALDYKKADDSTTPEEIEKINIIYQSPGRKWFNFKEVPDYEQIFPKMCLSCNDIYNSFQTKISEYKDTEYSILGVDYVIDDLNNPYIIEINHRSNYAHPKEIVDNVDLPAIEDTMRILIQKNEYNTDYVKVI